MENFKRQVNESDEELIFRICSMKTNETWQEIADGLNKELNTEYTESKFRKQYQSFQRMFDSVKHKIVDSNEHIEELDKKQDELYKQQVKTSDKLREYRGVMREEARIENLIDTMENAISKLPKLAFDNTAVNRIGSSVGILKISDWHIGKVVNNFFNKYNKQVACERVDKLIEETIKYCDLTNVKVLYVANLGDLIEGNLRVTTRVEAEENVIEQIMFVSELLANMIVKLQSYGLEIKYISTLDNHSRSTPDYKQHIEKESFVKLVDFYLRARLGDTIEFISNIIDDNIGYVRIDDRNHFFVHGHLKAHSPHLIVQNLAIPLNIKVDYVHIGHWHKSDNKEFHYAKVYTNPSLCGVDDYAFNNGWFSKAGQRLLIVDNGNEIDFNINLN